MNSPTVTVFIPCYNAERFIAETIDSILNQTFRDFEVLIIDDGSTDNSRSILEHYSRKDDRIRVLFNKRNRGVGFTRNRGIREARGKYLATMDADDIAVPFRLEKEVQFLNKHETIGIVSGGMYVIDEKGGKHRKFKNAYNSNEVKARMFFENVIINSASMYRLDVVREHNVRYKDNFHGIEDYMFWCTLLKYTNAVILDDYLVYYRIVQNGLTSTNSRNCNSERVQCINEVHRFMLASNGIRINKWMLNYCLPRYSSSLLGEEKKYNIIIYFFLLKILLQTIRKPYFDELKTYMICMIKLRIKK